MARMLVFDTETGGIDAAQHSILSLGAVVWEDGVPGAEFEVKIKEPTLTLTIEAMAINKIDLVQHASAAVTPADAMKQLRAFLRRHFKAELAGSGVPLVGHNVGFDIGFLKRLCRLSDQSFEELFSHRSTDTAGILRFMTLAGRSSLSGAGLDEALAYFQVNVNGGLRHTALEDARATAVLFTKLIELAKSAPPPVVEANPKPRRASKPRRKTTGSGATHARTRSSAKPNGAESRP